MAVRNILVIGVTGSGKSALCNVLTDTDEFKEGGYAVSETHDTQSRNFDWNENKYCVVDTVGIGNTKRTMKEVVSIIKKELKSMPGKIWQIFLVTDGRFSREEIEIYNSVINKFKESLVTVVRTNFYNFQNEAECNNDRDVMLKNNDIAKIIKRRKLIHVDNPPVNIICDDSDVILQNKINKKKRKVSRKILLDYLDMDKRKPWNFFS